MTFKCDECDFIEIKDGQLYRHKQVAHIGSKFKCDYCDFRGINRAIIKTHTDGVHFKKNMSATNAITKLSKLSTLRNMYNQCMNHMKI